MARGRKPGRPKARVEARVDVDLLDRFNAHFKDPFTGNLALGKRSLALEAMIRQFCDAMEKPL